MDTEKETPENILNDGEKPPDKKPAQKSKAISVSSSGAMIPSNHLELMTVIEQVAAGGGFPKRFDTRAKRLAAYNLANSLMGTRWQLILNNIAEIHGQMVLFGEGPGACAEQTGEVKEKIVYVIDKDYEEICTKNKNLDKEPYAGVCKIQRVGRTLKEFTYTIDQARHAGQYPAMKKVWKNKQWTGEFAENPESPWMKHTTVMLMRKAMNIAINIEFPDAKVGAKVAEYDFDIAPDLEPEVDEMREANRNVEDELNHEDENASQV